MNKELYSQYAKRFENHLMEFLMYEFNKNYNYQGEYGFTGSEYKFLDSLYTPVTYILSGGGKRVRPLIVMLVCETFEGNTDDSLDAAVAIELLHNFTLVHDDIMDNASARRGKPTIHNKWDVNTAILTGDELLGLSYRSLLKTKTGRISDILNCFTEGILEVCEGQAMDKEFETADEVTIQNYLVMIRKKTAELIKTSALIGAMIGGADTPELEAIGNYAINIGMAFQINDDLLDVTADENEFGKKRGGDILERKRTYLYLKALECAAPHIKKMLLKVYNTNSNSDKVKIVVDLYNELGLTEKARDAVRMYTDKAEDNLKILGKEKSFILSNFSQMLLNRQH